MAEFLFLLPFDAAPAAENMASDWLLLVSANAPQAPRLRFYDWSQPAWTFGYGQSWAAIREKVGAGGDLVRRPTGGGLVRNDGGLTYALVLPPEHPLAKARACESYKVVHAALAEALIAAGVNANLQPANCRPPSKELSVCFEKPETFDVIRVDNGDKIAGAAQKRTRQGLLLQGSVDAQAAQEARDWRKFSGVFTDKLAKALNALPDFWMRPICSGEELKQTTARFASKEWNEKR